MYIVFLLACLLSVLGCLTILAAVIAWVPFPRVLQAAVTLLGCWPLGYAIYYGIGLRQLSAPGHGGGPEAMVGLFFVWIIPWLLLAAGLCFLMAAFLLPLRDWLRERLLPELRPYTAADD